MSDSLTTLCSFLDASLAIDVWRNHLPAGYLNTTAACVVSITSDRRHQSKASRDVFFEVRVYGGTQKSTDAATTAETIIDALNNACDHSRSIQRIGEIGGQELPPELVTGWPSYRITGRALINTATTSGT